MQGEEIFFDQAKEITHHYRGDGKTIRSLFDFADVSFETQIEQEGDEVFLTWTPIREDRAIDEVRWPQPLSFDEPRSDWLTLLNVQQGLGIPNTFPNTLGPIHFDGLFNTAGATMPWFAQIKGTSGVLATCMTPWDAGYRAFRPFSLPLPS